MEGQLYLPHPRPPQPLSGIRGYEADIIPSIMTTTLEQTAEKPLATEFTTRGRIHTMIRREGDVAIFKLEEEQWGTPGYEVILVQHVKAGKVFGDFVEAHEAYPPSSRWGQQGWTSPDLLSAEARFSRLVGERSGITSQQGGAKIVEKPEDTTQETDDDLGELSGPGCETCRANSETECESCQ